MSETSWSLQSWITATPGQLQLTRWRYELRRTGLRVLLGPPILLVAIGAFALLLSFQSPQSVASILSFGLDLMPLVAALVAVGAVAEDDALELQLTLPSSYRSTSLRRLILALGWPCSLALAGTLILAATNRLVWPVPAAGDLISDQLIWLAPLLWLAGAGTTAALGMRTIAVGSGVVGLLWMLQEVLAGFFDAEPSRRVFWLFARYHADAAGEWYLNRAVLIGSAIVLFALAYVILGRSEHLLNEER